MWQLDRQETNGERAAGNRWGEAFLGLRARIETSLGRIADIIERYPFASAGALVTLVVLADLAQSSTTRLWNDELVTFDISTLSFSRMFAALNAGLDGQPPLSYILVRLSHMAFGAGEIATRLPFIIGFAVASLLLFAFVYQRCDAVWGLIAVLFLWLTDAFRYSVDARPYALILASCAASFVLWRHVSSGRRPRLASVGLAIALALGVASHFYAMLLVVPLAIGELVRSIRSRRIAPRLWIALGAGLMPLLFTRHQIASLAALYESEFWSKPQLRSLLDTYVAYLDLKAFSVTLLIVILLIACFRIVPAGTTHEPRKLRFEPHELAAVIALALFPLFVLVLAFIGTNAYVDRYALPATIGMSILFAFAIHIVLDGDARRAVAIVCVLLAAFLGFRMWPALRVERFGDQYLANSIRTAKALNGPIVVTSPQLFEFLDHYLEPAERARVFYLDDPALSVKYLGQDTLDRALKELSQWFPMNVVDYRTFLARDTSFWVYTGPMGEEYGWVKRALIDSNGALRAVSLSELEVFRYTDPSAADSTRGRDSRVAVASSGADSSAYPARRKWGAIPSERLRHADAQSYRQRTEATVVREPAAE